MTRFVVAVFAFLFLLAGRPALEAQDKGLTEKQKIEALIQHVEDMKDAKFVRNDKEYDAKFAARFLRGKWEANQKKINTANDFIQKVASVSSTSGKPYLIRFKNGKEMKSREYLLEKLKELERSATSAPQGS